MADLDRAIGWRDVHETGDANGVLKFDRIARVIWFSQEDGEGEEHRACDEKIHVLCERLYIWKSFTWEPGVNVVVVCAADILKEAGCVIERERKELYIVNAIEDKVAFAVWVHSGWPLDNVSFEHGVIHVNGEETESLGMCY